MDVTDVTPFSPSPFFFSPGSVKSKLAVSLGVVFNKGPLGGQSVQESGPTEFLSLFSSFWNFLLFFFSVAGVLWGDSLDLAPYSSLQPTPPPQPTPLSMVVIKAHLWFFP